MRIRSSDGVWTVEVIDLAGSGEWLRVKQHGWFCRPLVRSPDELVTRFGIDFADMQEVVD
ncbi:MAG TPA: hypothetical protein VHJ18_00845 [Streptosporangiaceae bacterium]|nr:hypothetical protein [Streptosporangiaceae bacterium]